MRPRAGQHGFGIVSDEKAATPMSHRSKFKAGRNPTSAFVCARGYK